MTGPARAHGWRLETTLVYHAGTGERRLTSSRRSQRGEGKLKAIVWTIVLVFGAFTAYRVIPAYVAEYQLIDKMQEQARFAIVNRYTEEQIRDNVFKVVQDLEIPVKREDIKIVVTVSIVKISLEYSVPVDLFVYHMDLHFSPNSENKSLT